MAIIYRLGHYGRWLHDWIPKKNDGWWSRLVGDRLHRQHN